MLALLLRLGTAEPVGSPALQRPEVRCLRLLLSSHSSGEGIGQCDRVPCYDFVLVEEPFGVVEPCLKDCGLGRRA